MSWLFSQALVEEYSEDISSAGEPSVQSSGNPTQLAYLPPDRMTAFSRLSRFGMTFKPLTEDLGQDVLTSFLEGFPAKTYQQQEEAQELMEPDQECGSTWRELLAKYDQDSSTWKTPQCSLLEDSIEFLGTWPRWGSMQDGVSYRQQTLVRHTKETGSGLWPTPLTQDSYERSSWKIIAQANEGGKARMTLTRKVKYLEKMWPTPVKSDWALRRPTENWKGTSDLPSVVWTANGGAQNLDKPAAKLNPTWVEWLIGWPLGWTDLKPLGTDKFLLWQQQHLDF
jgi:hypothetical protein